MSIEMVKEFHDKFKLPAEKSPGFPAPQDMIFRIMRQEEEVEELATAYEAEDLIAAFDALLDAAYIIYGTALRMGITPEMWNKGFAAVHEANMSKIRATDPTQSKYKNTTDIVKPRGWEGPEGKLADILAGNI